MKTSDVTLFLYSSVAMCGLDEHTNGIVLACSMCVCVCVCDGGRQWCDPGQSGACG